MLLSPPSAVAQTTGGAQGNPRLASLGIEIWPEYDRPAVLVILKGTVAEGVKLPAAVALRLPVAAGGPTAVAYSATADGNLLNLNYQPATAGEFVNITFDVPERFFHVEFYDPITTTTPGRDYRYIWPGDLAADRVTVAVQEPAGATALAVEPSLDIVSMGQEGLRYRAAELGAVAVGKALPIVVRYTKSDARPSAEIMKPQPREAPAAVASTADTDTPVSGRVLALRAGALLTVGASSAYIWRRRRRAVPPAAPSHRHCIQCGAPQAHGDRYCGGCGTKLA
jgi:hypothetical protein